MLDDTPIDDDGSRETPEGRDVFRHQVEVEQEAIAIAEERAAILEQQAALNTRSTLLCGREIALSEKRIRGYGIQVRQSCVSNLYHGQ